MALGLCMLGRYEFPFEKLRIDLAFENAWRDWPDRYKNQFKQVATDLRNGTDAVWVMTHVSERTQTGVFFWDTSGQTITIYSRADDWDSEDPNDVDHAFAMIDGDVPLEGWISLAQSFLDNHDREYG